MKAQPPRDHDVAVPERFLPEFRHADDPDWHWLEQRDDPAVKAFLEAANAHSRDWFSSLEPLIDSLYHGHLARRELAITGLATPLDHYTYWSETTEDGDYPSWWRHPNEDYRQKRCFLDLQARASDKDFLELGDMALSPDETWLAWTEDTQGDEYFTLMLKQLPDGNPEVLLEHIGPDLIWAEDNRTLLFTRYDATQRPESIWRLSIDEPTPYRIFHEPDPEYWLDLGKTRSREWLIIESASKDTTECHLIPAASPSTPASCFRKRELGVEYVLEHRPGYFYILHNRHAPHFRLDWAEQQRPTEWRSLLDHRQSHTLEGVDAFDWGLVITERDHDEAQGRLRTIELTPDQQINQDSTLPLPETPCSQYLADTPHFRTRRLRLEEESFTHPVQWIEFDLDSGERRLLKQQPVHGNLLPEQLKAQRIWATSHDGERVPVSIVARADKLGHSPMPVLLYGYGAYGEALDPWFSIARLELLDRGVAFAVAHVRGGGERGEPWYLKGKLQHKENSFQDFLAARDALVDAGLADDRRIVAYGASAGGLLVGASLNMRPQAFCAAVLDVPFVDVLRTMMNPNLPLTTAEYTEWGNPEIPDVHHRIAAYSPLDNLSDQPYPCLFLQSSWHDSRVPYWEPAKLYARLHERRLDRRMHDASPVLLHTDMTSGHGGASGRFKAWRDNARQDAFILWALGLTDSLDRS